MGDGAWVELQYRLVAAVMYKTGHYATCTLDEEMGYWLLFDGMLQGEGRDGPGWPEWPWAHDPTAHSCKKPWGYLLVSGTVRACLTWMLRAV